MSPTKIAETRPENQAANILSLLVPLAAFLLLVLVVQPWGDYPISDDYVYARISRRFAETGKFIFDHDSGAAFILQGVFAAPVIRILGFSHTHLRGLTLVFSAFTLYLIWQLMTYAAVRPLIKTFALLILVFNPIFAAVSMSFLTDIYGYALALLGATIWLGGRRRWERQVLSGRDDRPIVSWLTALLTALVMGSSFWIRQYCVLAFPALLGAAGIQMWLAGDVRRLKASAWRLVAGVLLFGMVIVSYFLFAKYRAVVPMSDFTSRLHRGWLIHPAVPLLEAGICLTYMTAFLLPMLLLFPWKRMGRGVVPGAVGLLVLGVATALILAAVPPHRDLFPRFPFLGNFIYNAGVGAILLPDVLLMPDRPQWPTWVWDLIECLLLAANMLWATVFLVFRQSDPRRKSKAAPEVLWFTALFVLACLTVTTVIDRLATYDRYYLPEIYGMILITSILLSQWLDSKQSQADQPASRGLVLRFAAALLPLAFFTTAGLHDFFRWNDVRWDLFHQAVTRGVSPANIQGGKELNGWATYDFVLAGSPPPGCIGPCSCKLGYYCLDDSYRIGMNVYGDYEVIASRRPVYWLAAGPPLYLSRRRTP